MDDPVAVSEHVLEKTRLALITGDLAAFQDRFIVPQTIGTFDGDRVIATPADLAEIFGNMCGYFQSTGVIDLKRRTLSAVFLAPDTVQATSVSQHLFKDYRPGPEIFIHGILRLQDGLWRIAESRYATDNVLLRQVLIPANTAAGGNDQPT